MYNFLSNLVTICMLIDFEKLELKNIIQYPNYLKFLKTRENLSIFNFAKMTNLSNILNADQF